MSDLLNQKLQSLEYYFDLYVISNTIQPITQFGMHQCIENRFLHMNGSSAIGRPRSLVKCIPTNQNLKALVFSLSGT